MSWPATSSSVFHAPARNISLLSEVALEPPPTYSCASGISEADSDIRNLLHAPSSSGAAAEDKMASSSDEDTSDEAFAGRHAALEAEEQQRFNTLAGKTKSSCQCCQSNVLHVSSS